MKQLQKKIILLLAGLFAGFSCLFYLFTFTLVKEASFKQQQEAVKSEVQLLSGQMSFEPTGEQSFSNMLLRLETASSKVEERITWITLDGAVLFDTNADIGQTENHLGRPEVQAILNGEVRGTAIRTSETTGQTLFYAAAPLFTDKKELTGIIRISKPIDQMEEVFTQLRFSMLLFMLFSLFIVLFLTSFWTKKFTGPMQMIASVTERLAAGDYKARYEEHSYAEVDQLGDTINQLAVDLHLQRKEIMQNNLQLNELVQNLIVGVMLLNDQKKIERINPVMTALLSFSSKANPGCFYYEGLIDPELAALIEQAYTDQQTQNQEIILRKMSKERTFDATVVPYKDDRTKKWNVIVLLYELTHLKKLEKVRTEFAANVSHELRTPLTALKGFSETLLDGAYENQDILIEFLRIIHKESERLDAIVGDILELSKLENQTAHFSKEPCEVTEVMDETMMLLQHKADRKQIRFVRNDAGNLWFNGDRNRLKQILVNLTDNAISYTPEAGEVTLDAAKTSDKLVLSVADNGIGIPLQDQDRIFERFYRVDKDRSRESGGTGLGLSIVKHLVENFEGTIRVESTEGEGTIFTVELPLSDT